MRQGDTCTDPTCFNGKIAAHVERKKAQLIAKDPELVVVSGQIAQDEGGELVGPGDPAAQARQVFELDKPLREARDEFEKNYFEFHLAKENGSMTRVAEKTGLERTHLYRKLKQLGVDLSRSKKAA